MQVMLGTFIPVRCNKMKISLQKSKARYKHYDRRVRESQAFHTEKYVFLDNSHVSNVSNSQAVTITRKAYENLQFKTTEPFCNVNVQNNTVTFSEEGILNTVSIDSVTHARSITLQTHRTPTSARPEPELTKYHTTRESSDFHMDKNNTSSIR